MRYLTALFPLLLLALNACGAGEVAIRPSVFPSQFAPGQIRERLSNLKLINYYPVGNAQTNVWLNWQPEVIDSDNDFFARAFPPNSRPALSLSEYQYGLYRTDGTPKRAASSIAAMFASNSIDTSFNNSLEQNALGLPTHWLRWQAEDAAFARDAQVSHSGKASARITASTANKVGLPAFYLSPVQPIAPGQTATATVWARGQRSTGITRLTLAWFDARQKYIGANSSANLSSGTTAWTQLRVRAVVPLNAAYVEIHLVSANNRGTAWFDDVTFEAK